MGKKEEAGAHLNLCVGQACRTGESRRDDERGSGGIRLSRESMKWGKQSANWNPWKIARKKGEERSEFAMVRLLRYRGTIVWVCFQKNPPKKRNWKEGGNEVTLKGAKARTTIPETKKIPSAEGRRAHLRFGTESSYSERRGTEKKRNYSLVTGKKKHGK